MSALGQKRTSITYAHNVRFTPNSGHYSALHRMSAFSHEETFAAFQKKCSLTTLREKLVKIGATIVRHGRNVTFQLAEVVVSGDLFRKILSLIDDLRPRPVPA